MSGIFGTSAVLITDVNLLLQVISFLFILVGLWFKIKGRFKNHGFAMGGAVILHLLSFLLAMGPAFMDGFDFFTTDTSFSGVQTMWVHAITGAVALILGIFLVIAWFLKSSEIKACARRKRLMGITVLLWFVSLIFGVATYVIFYL